MPERLDRVEIALSSVTITLSWPSRDALLEELTFHDRGRSVRDAFEAVGSSRPVELTLEQKSMLLYVIEHWIGQLFNGVYDLPEGIVELRNALHDELPDATTYE